MQQERKTAADFVSLQPCSPPFSLQTWCSNISFLWMWHFQLLPGAVCEGGHREDTVWIFSNAGPEENTGVSFALPARDIFQGLPCLVFFPFAGWHSLCFAAPHSRPMPFLTKQPHATWNGDVLGWAAGYMVSLPSQLSSMPSPAQRKSCVPHTVARDYVNMSCSYTQPSEEMLREARSSCRAHRYFYLQERVYGWRRTRNKGQRHRLRVTLACLQIVRLVV